MNLHNVPLKVMFLSKVVATVRTGKLSLGGVSADVSQPHCIIPEPPGAARMGAGVLPAWVCVHKLVLLQATCLNAGKLSISHIGYLVGCKAI